MRRLGSIQLETNENLDINLSPLIDMVFLLLIFFMVTTTFVQQTGVEVNKPSAISAGQLDDASILIAVDRAGRVMHAGREIGLGGVRGVVARQQRAQPVPVVIQADESVPTGLLVEVIDECKLGGAVSVNLAAEARKQ